MPTTSTSDPRAKRQQLDASLGRQAAADQTFVRYVPHSYFNYVGNPDFTEPNEPAAATSHAPSDDPPATPVSVPGMPRTSAA